MKNYYTNTEGELFGVCHVYTASVIVYCVSGSLENH